MELSKVNSRSELIAKIESIVEKYDEQRLNIKEFIDVMDYNLNTSMLLKNWHSFDRYLPILIDDELLIELGYTSDDRNNREKFKKILKSNNIPYKIYDYQEYIEWIDQIDQYAYEKPEKNFSNIKKQFIVMEIEDFKEAVISMRSDVAKATKKYYIKLEAIVQDYHIYQRLFEASGKNKVINLLVNSNKKTEEYIKKTDGFIKQTKEYIKKTEEYTKKTEEYTKKTEEYTKKTEEYIENSKKHTKQLEALTNSVKETNKKLSKFIKK